MATPEQTPAFTGGREHQGFAPIEKVPPPPATRDLKPSTKKRIKGAESRHGRIQLAERFQAAYPDWLGHTPGEMRLALDTLRSRVIDAQGNVGGRSLEMVKELIETAEGYRDRASLAVIHLDLAKVLEEDEAPSAELVKGDPDAKDALAEYLLAKQSSGRGIWNPKVGRRNPSKPTPREQLKHEIVERIENGKPDGQLVAEWKEARPAEAARAQFWQLQLDSLQDVEMAQGIIDEEKPGP